MDEETKLFEMQQSEYETVKLLKKSERSSVFTVRRKSDGKRFLMRKIEGNAEIYKKLPGVSCENLPEIIKVFENENETFVVEEFVPGETLFEILECGTFSEKEAIKCVSEVCKGLSVLHEHGIVHRDIKPENIIMNGEKTVLIDFDASRKTDPEKTSDTRILGTTGYASPEQYGLSQTDARSDIYSLGVVLNIMLTGEHPSTKLAEGYLGDVVQKCTMINPDMRFQSADELEKALNKAKKVKGKNKFVFAAAMVIALSAAAIFLSTGHEISEEIPNGEEIVEEVFEAENEPEITEDAIKIKHSGEIVGKSNLLPEDFYRYWSAEEFITENIELVLPGDLEKYVTYEIVEDVLTFTIGNVPAEEWKKAFEEDPNSSTLSAKIVVGAPDESVVGISSHNGNGPTYANLKRQYADGIQIEFWDFDPECEKDYKGHEIAEIANAEEYYVALPIERESVFYAVYLWEKADGELIWQILPFQFVLAKDCRATFFKSILPYPEYGEPDPENLWMDELWKAIDDPERIVFRTVNNGRKKREASFFTENGVEISILERPGYIHAKVTAEASERIEAFARAELFVLPPDVPERNPEESFEEWNYRVYKETEYAGYKITATGVGVDSNEGTAKFIYQVIESGMFYDIKDDGTVTLPFLPMYNVEGTDGKTWYIGQKCDYPVMLINWYLENPEENPEAKPELCEYVYIKWENEIVKK